MLFVCVACAQNPKIEVLGKLPSSLAENSACEVLNGSIWTTEDHGNKPILYRLDKSGNLTHQTKIAGVENNDWEELSSDAKGNLYIGDFGNNDNIRRDLSIYKIEAKNLSKDETAIASKTTFHYPEQKEFPPKKSERFYDCEAFFVSGDYFYLFTKNRSANFDGTTILYRVPNKPGNFTAQKISEFRTCGTFNRCAITSADISPDEKKVALLTGDKIFLFTNFKSDNFLGGKSKTIELSHFSQKEGLGFSSNGEILITDEKTKKIGGNLYRYKLSEAKP